jgi:single-stranded DNA-binding protein
MRTSAEIDITGFVGNDPKSPSANNPNFVTFSVSVNIKKKDHEDVTIWYECQTSNEHLSKIIKDYIKKGSPVRVRGVPRFDTYRDKNGNYVASCKINIDKVEDLSQGAKEKKSIQSTIESIGNGNNYDIDDSIPF